MNGIRYRIFILSFCLFIMTSGVCSKASSDGVTVLEETKSVNSTENSLTWEEITNQEREYLSHEEFLEYYESLCSLINKNKNPEEAMLKLYLLLIRGEVSTSDVQMVLEDGYLTEYIKKFKDAGVLSSTYKLPDDVIPQNAIINHEYSEETAISIHEYDGLTEEAFQALRYFTADDLPRNAYIDLPARTQNTILPGNILSLSYYNMEPLDINFIGEDGYSDVSWHFGKMLIREDSEVNLKVDHTDKIIKFHLGNTLFPSDAQVMIKMPEVNTRYNAYGDDGSFRKTYISDQNGYITMAVKSDADSVRIAEEMVSKDIDKATSSNTEKVSPVPVKYGNMTGLQIVSILISGLTFFMFLLAWVSERRRK